MTFNRGLNIVEGVKTSDSDTDTYNGVGKSLSLQLIHLILGASFGRTPKDKKLKSFLSNYGIFTLEFMHLNEKYTIKKNFAETGCMLNGEPYNGAAYKRKLDEIFLPDYLDDSISFKNIMNCFSRRYGYFQDPLSQQGQDLSNYPQKITNLALLGVDIDLVHEKQAVKNNISKLNTAKNAVKEYEDVLSRVNVKDVKESLNILIDSRDSFVIAKNYDEFKKNADEKTSQINTLRDELYYINNTLARKSSSLEQAKSLNVDSHEIEKIFNEANFFFPDDVKVRLDDAKAFHINLMSNRVERLQKDINRITKDKENLLEILGKIETERDSILKDLNSKGALEEYNSINERIRTMTAELNDLQKYQNILKSFNEDKNNLDIENNKIQSYAKSYLQEIDELIDDLEDKFRKIVKRFYAHSGGTFSVTVSQDAKYLYDINVEIPSDGSQGINEVKIFAYDLLLFTLHPDILGFMAHDGCIFSEMDPRQKSMILKLALEYIEQKEMQYFINIGEDTLNSILDEGLLNDDDKKAVRDSIMLTLSDKDASSKLFGEQFA